MFSVQGLSIQLLFFLVGLLFFLVLELRFPYRPASLSKAKRWISNLSLTLFNRVLLHLIFSASVVGALGYVQNHKLGLLNMIEAPSWVKILVTIAFMDFMLYIWHLLNHQVPFLWRFHRVHHSDLNMDVSTATRFHFGELAIWAVIRITLILFLGISISGLLIFETIVVICIQLHHSSLKIPKWFEKIFWILFVPPSMHRIHHSVVIRERNTNYGAIFSLWDRILGTLRTAADQDRIRIGVGAYPRPEKLNFHHLLLMPFTRPVR